MKVYGYCLPVKSPYTYCPKIAQKSTTISKKAYLCKKHEYEKDFVHNAADMECGTYFRTSRQHCGAHTGVSEEYTRLQPIVSAGEGVSAP